MELYQRVRRACHVEGMSIREAARVFGLHRDTVRKMLMFSLPPGYRRSLPAARPKLDPYTAVIDRILEEDKERPRKQRHSTCDLLFAAVAPVAFDCLFDGESKVSDDYLTR